MATPTEIEYLICSFCGKEMVYPAESHGMVSECPHCKAQVVLAGTTVRQAPLQQKAKKWKTADVVTVVGLVLCIGIPLVLFVFADQSSSNSPSKTYGGSPGALLVGRLREAQSKNQEIEKDAQVRTEALQKLQQRWREQSEKEKRRIVVKGFYIGMTLQEIQNAVARLGQGWQIEHYDPNEVAGKMAQIERSVEIGNQAVQEHVMSTKEALLKEDIVMRMRFDYDGKIDYIYIGPNYSNLLFGSADMEAKEFCQTFANAYPIPQLDPVVGGWEYTSPSNVRVRVGNDKSVTMWRVQDRNEVQKNFN